MGPHDGISVLIKRGRDARVVFLHHVRTPGRRWPSTSQEKRALTRHQICQHLDLGCPASRAERNKCLMLKLPSLCYFVIVAQTDSDTYSITNSFKGPV